MKRLLCVLLLVACAASAAPRRHASLPPPGCPIMTDGNVFLYFSGPTSGCNFLTQVPCLTGEALPIGVAGFDYNFDCSVHSAEFDFGDGSANVVAEGRTAPTVEHRYAAPAVYTLRVTLRNNRGTITLEQPIAVRTDFFPPPAQ